MNMFALNIIPSLKKFFHELELQIDRLDLNRCDERTLYIPITLQYKGHKAACDLIYLIDKEDLYGAISLNEKYDHARNFFLQHFQYELLYRDELFIADILRHSTTFKQHLKAYAEKYPKHIKQKFFK